MVKCKVSFTCTLISKRPLPSVVVPLTLLRLIILTLVRGWLVLSLTTIPETFWEGSTSCAVRCTESSKKKKTTKYFINWFKTLKVINQSGIFCSFSIIIRKLTKGVSLFLVFLVLESRQSFQNVLVLFQKHRLLFLHLFLEPNLFRF